VQEFFSFYFLPLSFYFPPYQMGDVNWELCYSLVRNPQPLIASLAELQRVCAITTALLPGYAFQIEAVAEGGIRVVDWPGRRARELTEREEEERRRALQDSWKTKPRGSERECRMIDELRELKKSTAVVVRSRSDAGLRNGSERKKGEKKEKAGTDRVSPKKNRTVCSTNDQMQLAEKTQAVPPSKDKTQAAPPSKDKVLSSADTSSTRVVSTPLSPSPSLPSLPSLSSPSSSIRVVQTSYFVVPYKSFRFVTSSFFPLIPSGRTTTNDEFMRSSFFTLSRRNHVTICLKTRDGAPRFLAEELFAFRRAFQEVFADIMDRRAWLMYDLKV